MQRLLGIIRRNPRLTKVAYAKRLGVSPQTIRLYMNDLIGRYLLYRGVKRWGTRFPAHAEQLRRKYEREEAEEQRWISAFGLSVEEVNLLWSTIFYAGELEAVFEGKDIDLMEAFDNRARRRFFARNWTRRVPESADITLCPAFTSSMLEAYRKHCVHLGLEPGPLEVGPVLRRLRVEASRFGDLAGRVHHSEG